MPSPKRWADLSAGTKRSYQREGIHSKLYNRWYDKPAAERTRIDREAKASGYRNGLHYTAVEVSVRLYAEKKITPATPAHEAARKLVQGQTKKSGVRKMIPRLFNFKEWDHLQWSDFMSP
jgi:hypothetical protein